MSVHRAFAAILSLTLAANVSAKYIDVSYETTAENPHPLQKAIESAWPGDTVLLQPGSYFEDIHSVRDGTEIEPIVITGPASAVLQGIGGEGIVLIKHDYIHLEGFSVNGVGHQDVETADPKKYRDHLIHVHGNRVRVVDHKSHTHRSGIVGFEADGLTLTYAGSSCVKLSYFVTHSQITNNNILHCGKNAKICDSGFGCGSGIDLGTAISQRMANVGAEVDRSSWNVVDKNFVSDVSGACITLHEGAEFNLLHGNSCLSSGNAGGAGVMIRGDANVIRFNSISGVAGAALGFGGEEDEFHTYGVFNQVYFNQLAGNAGGSVMDGKVPEPAGLMCRNVVDAGEDADDDRLTKECPSYIDNAPEDEASSDNVVTRTGVNDSEPGPHSDVGGDKQHKYRCNEVPSSSVKSSEGDPAHPSDPAPLVLGGGGPGYHWSRYGIGQWVEFAMDSAAGAPNIEAVEITFFEGDSRVQYFQMLADGEVILGNGASSGTTTMPELFMLKDPITADRIRIIGQGNGPTDPSKPFSMWNNLVRVRLCQETPEPKHRRTTTPGP